MKNLLLLFFLLLSSLAKSQCQYSVNKVDEFTKIKELRTLMEKVSYPVLGVNELSLGLIQYTQGNVKEYYVIASTETADAYVCMTSDSKMYILTVEDSVFILPHNDSFKCTETNGSFQKGFFAFYVKPWQLEALSEMNIMKIRLDGQKSNMDFQITGKNIEKERGKNYFIRTVKCVLNL